MQLFREFQSPLGGIGIETVRSIPYDTPLLSEAVHMVIVGRAAMSNADKNDVQLLQLSCLIERRKPRIAKRTFDANSFETDENTEGVFLRASRFNHSCAPNAHVQWNAKLQRLTIHAIENIPANTEILVNYRVQYSFMKTTHRRTELRKHYKFKCTCTACQPITGDTVISDSRREDMQVLENEIENNKLDENRETSPSKRLAIFKDIKTLRLLLQQERLPYPHVADVYLKELDWYAREKEHVTAGIESVEYGATILGLALQTARTMLDLDVASTGHDSDQVDKALKWIRDVKAWS